MYKIMHKNDVIALANEDIVTEIIRNLYVRSVLLWVHLYVYG